MILHNLIDQHPAVAVGILLIYFVLLWLVVGAAVSLIGGWHSLAKRYRTQEAFTGAERRMQSARMRWLTNYNGILTLGVNREGFYLATVFLFRFMHPPMLIPWSEISMRTERGWIFEYVVFTMGRELTIPVRIRAKLAANLREAAGSYWPVEEM
jgi:hypothetical protein